MRSIASDLRDLLGPAGVLDGARERRARVRDSWPQSHWWSEADLDNRMPAAVALPEREEQVVRLLEYAHQNGVILVARGGGSGVLGAAASLLNCVVLDTSRLTSGFQLGSDAQGTFVRAGAGMLGGELESRLNAAGFSLMNFPASLAVSSVGGWIATRAFGQLSTRYGGIEEQALAVRAVYPGGDLRVESPAAHLGAEGTLAALTEVTLRVRPLPKGRDGLGLDFADAGEGLACAREALSQLAVPSVMRLYSPTDAWASGLRGGGGSGAVGDLLRSTALKGFRWLGSLGGLLAKSWLLLLVYEDVPEGSAQMIVSRLGAKPSAASAAPAGRWWEKRYQWDQDKLTRTFESGCFADTLDVWGRWDALAALESGLREAMSPFALVLTHFSHFSEQGACLYVTFAGAGSTAPETRGLHECAWRAGLDACVRLGGRTNHHHGVGLAKLPWIRTSVDAAWHADLRQAKAAADPNGILNPGKLCL